MDKISTRKGALAVGCLCFGSSVGLVVDVLSIFMPAIRSELGLSSVQIALVPALLNAAVALASPLVTSLLHRWPLRRLICMGILLSAVCMIGISCTSSIILMEIFAVPAGIGIACFSTLPVIALIGSWYGEQNGAAMGIAMACSGAMGALASPIFGSLIVSLGWRAALRVDCLTLCAAALPAGVAAARGPFSRDAAPARKKTRSLRFGPAFPLLAILSLLFTWTGALVSHLSLYGTDCGLSLAEVSCLVSADMVANILSKTAAGWLSDRKSPVTATAISSVLAAAGLVLLLAGRDFLPLMAAGSFLYGFSTATYTVLIALLVPRYIRNDADEAFSYINMLIALSFAGFIGFQGALRDVWGSYMPILASAIAASLAATLLAQQLERSRR